MATALGILCLAAILAVWGWRRFHAPSTLREPPVVDLSGTDPEAAEAIRIGRERVKQSPASAGAWGDLGMVLIAHDAFAPGRLCLEQAALLAPEDARWPYLAGIALLKGESQPAAAIRVLEEAARLPGREPVPRLKLGEVYLEQGRIEDAEREFRGVVEVNPRNARALAGLGRAKHSRGDLKGALEHLQASARASPQVKSTRALLAEVYQRLGRPADAKQEQLGMASLPEGQPWPDPYWQQVLDRRAGAIPRIERATDLFQRGRGADGIQLLRETVERYPRALLPRLSLGRLLLQAGDAPGAEDALRQAALLEPASFEAQHELGSALLQQGKDPAAVEAFQRAIEIRPDFAPSHHALGQCRLRSGDIAAAIDAFRGAVRHRPNYAQAHKDLGRCLAGSVSPVEAAEGIEHLRAAARLNPSDVETQKLIERIQNQ
jgi:tetratricopeptide (TPR) repeat protein